MPEASTQDHEVRERCYQCFRPMKLCFCESIPRIDNRTRILILQHVGERFHPFNTARIVRNALRNCQLIADHNERLGAHHLPIQPNAGLLYPHANAPSLTDLPPAERPSQLVIVDGTWHQAKAIVRDVPQLHDLPCYRLRPTSPGQYRIRREPDEQSLSTLEATVAALHALEPDTAGLNQLLSAFNRMVEDQLLYSAANPRWRKARAREPRHRDLPRALLQDSERLVVAYGEATPRRPGSPTATPVNWVAQRLGTTQRFSCILRQQRPLSTAELGHMQLSAADFGFAVSPETFRRQWHHFLRRDDVLIVYHPRTNHLLRHIEASQPRCLALKSIFGKKRQSGFRTLEELIEIERVTLPPADGKNRAQQRLDMAVALVEHLRPLHLESSVPVVRS